MAKTGSQRRQTRLDKRLNPKAALRTKPKPLAPLPRAATVCAEEPVQAQEAVESEQPIAPAIDDAADAAFDAAFDDDDPPPLTSASFSDSIADERVRYDAWAATHPEEAAALQREVDLAKSGSGQVAATMAPKQSPHAAAKTLPTPPLGTLGGPSPFADAARGTAPSYDPGPSARSIDQLAAVEKLRVQVEVEELIPSGGVFITLPVGIMKEYAAQAKQFGLDIPALLRHRLEDCFTHDSPTALYVDDELRLILGRFLSSPLTSPDDLLRAVRGLCTARATGHEFIAGTEPWQPVEITVDRESAYRIAQSLHAGVTYADRIREWALEGIRHRIYS